MTLAANAFFAGEPEASAAVKVDGNHAKFTLTVTNKHLWAPGEGNLYDLHLALLDGDVRQACTAAVMSIQSLMGLLCDKIGGLVQVPCLSRNMTAVAIAGTCANATMAGVEALVPLEETIASMLRSGGAIRDNGINRMGACWTATGCRLAAEQKARNAKLR